MESNQKINLGLKQLFPKARQSIILIRYEDFSQITEDIQRLIAKLIINFRARKVLFIFRSKFDFNNDRRVSVNMVCYLKHLWFCSIFILLSRVIKCFFRYKLKHASRHCCLSLLNTYKLLGKSTKALRGNLRTRNCSF